MTLNTIKIILNKKRKEDKCMLIFIIIVIKKKKVVQENGSSLTYLFEQTKIVFYKTKNEEKSLFLK